MASIKDVATAFLAHERIAVTGVSRTPKGHGSNMVYQRLRQRGYEGFRGAYGWTVAFPVEADGVTHMWIQHWEEPWGAWIMQMWVI